MNGGAFGDQREDFTSVLGFLKTAVLETTGTKPGQVEALVAKKLMDRPFHLSNTEMTSAMVVPRRPCKRYKKVLTKMPLSTDDQKATEILKELSQPKPLTRVKVQKVKCRDMFRDMPKEAQKYSMYKPMNDLWQSYTTSLLGRNVTNAEQILSKLSKVDLNGAYITVKDSICHTMKGISGIVLFECTNMFYIITPKDALKSIPKKGSIFSIMYNDITIYIYGNQWRGSPADRISKKFKSKPTIQLRASSKNS